MQGKSYWTHTGGQSNEGPVTWFIAGTPPNWQASPLVVVVDWRRIMRGSHNGSGRNC